jgi:ribosomal protein S18 acetylase RimI-like enzyme
MTTRHAHAAPSPNSSWKSRGGACDAGRQAALMDDIVIVEYSPEHGPELVKMWRDSFEQAVGVIDPHTLDEQLQYLEKKVVPESRVLVVLGKPALTVIAFMASTSENIFQLYVHVKHQNRGIGSMLVNIAKQNSNGRLRLFTFKANKAARRFYERHGFKALRRGFEKEWQLEDIEYEWSGTQAAT